MWFLAVSSDLGHQFLLWRFPLLLSRERLFSRGDPSSIRFCRRPISFMCYGSGPGLKLDNVGDRHGGILPGPSADLLINLQ